MLRKNPAGWRAIDLKHEVMVFRIGRPLAAFSMIALRYKCVSFSFSVSLLQRWLIGVMYRSITVITGHVSNPAVAALTISTPNRVPNRSVFHFLDEVERSERAVMVRDGVS